MKRVLGLLLVFVLSLTGVFAASSSEFSDGEPIPYMCSELTDFATLVDGQTPSTDDGRGAVDICNHCYYCGRADGVCPSDFYNDGAASCANAPDIDCLGCIDLQLQIEFEPGNPITLPLIQVEVSIVYDAPYNIPQFSSTTILPLTSEGVIEGIDVMTNAGFTVYVSYVDDETGDAYEGEYYVGSEEVVRGADSCHPVPTIILTTAQCNPDCTRGNSPLCDPTCIQAGECAFNLSIIDENGVDTGEVYEEEDVLQALQDQSPVLQNLDIVLNTFTDEDLCVQTQDLYAACAGPIQQNPSYLITGPVCSTIDYDDDISNLVTRVHRVWYDQGEFSQPVELVIMTWDEEN